MGQGKADFRLEVTPGEVGPGGQFEATLEARIDPGWHLYSMSQPPGGPIPTTIAVVEDSVFVQEGSVSQPEPLTWFDQNFGIQTEYFEGTVDFQLPVRVKPTAESGSHPLAVKVRYMLCSDTLCLPPQNKTITSAVAVVSTGTGSEVQPGASLPVPAAQGAAPARRTRLSAEQLVSLRTALSVDNVHPGSSFQVAVIADLEQGWHVNAHQPTLDYLIPTELSLQGDEDFTFGDVEYPASVRLRFDFADQELDVYEGQIVVRVPVTVTSGSSPGETGIEGSLRYQACNDQICLAPVTRDISIPIRIASLDQASRPINSEFFESVALTSSGDPSVSVALGAPGSDVTRLIEEQGLALALVSIFVLGLALNLTPCVYPMIPVTIGYFSQQSEGKTGRVFGLALMYVLGIAVTYSTLGVVAALTGQMFGALLQNFWVLVGIAVVMVGLALSLFGVYQIQAPSFIRQKVSGGSGGGVLGALIMGLVVGVVAAPCVGPVTLGLLTYVGSTGNPWLGFWMFFTLSLGLGAPYVALGTFSGGLKKLPRSGIWMLWVEKLFGFALIGMALYFIAPLLPGAIVPWLVATLAVIAGVWLGWLEKGIGAGRGFYWVRKTVGVLALAIGLYALVPQEPGVGIQWQHFDLAEFEQARSSGRGVILDFYADWCIPCRELDRFTFSDSAVISAVGPFLMMKVDLTQYESPESEALRKQFGVSGVPTVVFIDAQGNEVSGARVVGYVGPDDFLQRVQWVLSPS